MPTAAAPSCVTRNARIVLCLGLHAGRKMPPRWAQLVAEGKGGHRPNSREREFVVRTRAPVLFVGIKKVLLA